MQLFLLVNADLLDLRDEDLKESHDGLQGKFLLPALNLEPIESFQNDYQLIDYQSSMLQL